MTRSPATAFAVGILAGGLSEFFGVGCGPLMILALARLLRVRPERAVATALVAVIPTVLLALWNFQREPRIQAAFDWVVVIELAFGSLVGAMIGAILAAGKRPSIRRSLGVLVALVGMGLIHVANNPGALVSAAPSSWYTVLALGFGIGVLGGVPELGGGVAMVPALGLLLGYPQKLSEAVSLAVVAVATVPIALVHFRRGNVVVSLALWLSAGGMLGVQLVYPLAERISDMWLRACFGAFLIAVGVYVTGRKVSGPGETAANA